MMLTSPAISASFEFLGPSLMWRTGFVILRFLVDSPMYAAAKAKLHTTRSWRRPTIFKRCRACRCSWCRHRSVGLPSRGKIEANEDLVANVEKILDDSAGSRVSFPIEALPRRSARPCWLARSLAAARVNKS
eukprot:scaffold45053_cov45-Phaeocystis_antarctica.AAC.1